MALIPALVSFSAGTIIRSADVNSNLSAIRDAFNNTAVLTDVARTITVKHVIQLAGPQLRIGVDGSNYFEFSVGATGLVTLDAVGAGAGFKLSDPVIVGPIDPGGAEMLRVGGDIRSGVTHWFNSGTTPRFAIGSDALNELFFSNSGGNQLMRITQTALHPATAALLTLGTAALPWGDGFIRIGTSSSAALIGGTAHVNAGSVAGGANNIQTDLMTYSLPANALNATGRGLRITAWGTFVASTNQRTVRLQIGAAEWANFTTSSSATTSWHIDAVLVRTGVAAQDGSCSAHSNSSFQGQGRKTAAEDMTAAIVIKCTGQAASVSNEVVQEGLIVEYVSI